MENRKHITSHLAIRTLEKVLHSIGCNPKNMLLRSDQGSQFTSLEFISYCRDYGILQSMSYAGHPYDNAPMECYYNTLKAELINQYIFNTDKELDHTVQDFAYLWYNQIRPHSYNHYMTLFDKRYSS